MNSNTYKFYKRMDGIDFYAPSRTENKKYDAYVLDNNNVMHIIPFGDIRFQHYKDNIGYYSAYNHYDKERRQLYRQRHKHDNLNKISAGYLSWNYLW
jgi:hypothetical protein